MIVIFGLFFTKPPKLCFFDFNIDQKLRIMSAPKLLLAFLLSVAVLLLVEADRDDLKITSNSSDGSLTPRINCGEACAARCLLASRQKLCKRACGTCCARCNCVPPGTSGNQQVCPCYYAMTTHGGRRKCP